MNLILWRHADAEDAAPGKPDAARSLTARGEQQAGRMAGWLKSRLAPGAVVMASPARRAQQTADALTRRFETRAELGTGADARSVLRAAGWPGGGGTVVVVGHQPTLGQAAALALAGVEAGWSLRKGALWWLESRDGGETVVRAVMTPELLD